MRTTIPAERLLDLVIRCVEALEEGALPLEALERTFEDVAKAFGADEEADLVVLWSFVRLLGVLFAIARPKET